MQLNIWQIQPFLLKKQMTPHDSSDQAQVHFCGSPCVVLGPMRHGLQTLIRQERYNGKQVTYDNNRKNKES